MRLRLVLLLVLAFLLPGAVVPAAAVPAVAVPAAAVPAAAGSAVAASARPASSTDDPAVRPAAAPVPTSTLCLPECAPVVVLGVPGLRWDDVGPATPTLQRLARESAVGVLSVKAVPEVSCPADGWLTVGAGNRAVAAGIGRAPCTAEIPSDRDAQVAANAEQREGAELTALDDAVGGCVDAVGDGPRLAAPSSGRPRSLGLTASGAPTPPGRCDVLLREAPAVAGEGDSRAATAAAADEVVARLLRRAGTLLVVGLSAAPGEDTARLHLALAHGPTFPGGALRSASTRRAPYVQLVDVAPTVLDLLAVEPPASMTGEPWQSVGPAPTPAELRDVAGKARAQKDVTVPFFVVLLAAELLLVAGLLALRRPRAAEVAALAGVAALAASYLANLVPWWRAPSPLLALLAVVAFVAAAVGATAWRAGRGPAHPAGLVCAFVAAVLVVDLVTGAHLQMSSVGGYSPLVAGRFAGIGNVAFGVLAAAALLATAALTRSAALAAAVGVAVVAVDGAPPWGSDVGGVLALVPAFALLALLLSGRRASPLRLLLAGAAGVVVVAAFALADWSRPSQDRTHLGRFVQDVADGTAGDLLRRKAEAVLGLLFASPVTALLPLVVAAAVYLVVRPPGPLRHAFAVAPRWRAGLLATGLASAIGFAVNDSGAAVPAMAIVVALPATGAVVLRARRAPTAGPRL